MFTEKAAAELRVRLRGELARAELHEALRELEVARIGTIHAFAAGLLRERPVEAGVDPGFTVADPLTARLLLDRTWEAWLPEALSDPAAADAVRGAIERGLGLDRLRELAFALVEMRDRLDSLPSRGRFGAASRPQHDVRETLVRLADLASAAARDRGPRRALADLAVGPPDRGAAEADQVQALLGPARLPTSSMAREQDEVAKQERARRVPGRFAARAVEAAQATARHNLIAASPGRPASSARTTWPRAGQAAWTSSTFSCGPGPCPRPGRRATGLPGGDPLPAADEFQDTDPLQLEMVVTRRGRAAWEPLRRRRPETEHLPVPTGGHRDLRGGEGETRQPR